MLASRMDAEMDGMAAGLSMALVKDGQQNPTANLPMATFHHTGVGNASARTDYASAAQVQDGGLTYAATVAGTADAIVLTVTPAITAYAPGAIFKFIASGANTGAVTVNINSVGAQPVKGPDGSALVAGEIRSGQVVNIVCKTATVFQVINKWILPATGRFIGAQVFTASGTYTPNALTTQAIVEMCGGGGGGGGAAATSGNTSVGRGGSAGGYLKFFWAAPAVTAVTIAAGGAGNSGAAGNTGGTVSLGAIASCVGGGGGQTIAAGTSVETVSTQAGGGTAPTGVTGGTILATARGLSAQPALRLGATGGIATSGANSPFGGGGLPQSNVSGGNYSNAGFPATGNGAGGGGAANFNTQSAVAGGDGSDGVIIIYEFT